MDSSQPNDQASGSQAAAKPSIDSLRTVEFRTTLRGYHMDDVDEYLERVAVEAEALQEQMRLASDRVKQATERVTSLEQQLEQARRTQQAQQAQNAQKAQATPSCRARRVRQTTRCSGRCCSRRSSWTRPGRRPNAKRATWSPRPRHEPRSIVADAEEHVRVMTEDAERSLREEVTASRTRTAPSWLPTSRRSRATSKQSGRGSERH